MLPFKRILCPTDFSEPSFEALKAANELAMHFKSNLYVIHVVPPIPVMPPLDYVSVMYAETKEKAEVYKMELVKQSEEALKEVLMEKTGDRVGLYPIITHGPVDEEIITLIKEKEIDLVVMGTHGQTGVSHFVFGSIAEKVVRRASCPVMVITGKD